MGHVISPNGIQPILKRADALRNLTSPQSKRDVTKVLGCLGFYSCYITNLHVDSQRFYDLIIDSTPFHWTEEHEKLFSSIKERIHSSSSSFHWLPASYSCGLCKCWFTLYSYPTLPRGKEIYLVQLSCNWQSVTKTAQYPSRTMRNRISSPDIRTLHHWIIIPHLSLLWS